MEKRRRKWQQQQQQSESCMDEPMEKFSSMFGPRIYFHNLQLIVALVSAAKAMVKVNAGRL